MRAVKTNILLSLTIILLIHLEFIESSCVINYPSDIETSPIYAKTLGKYTLQLPFTGTFFNLHDGEVIQAFCRTSFTSISYVKERLIDDYYHESYREFLLNQTSISLKCQGNNLYYNDSILEERMLQCNKINWSVYDTNDAYEWCEKTENSKTFLLAAKGNEDHYVLAGICFNLNDWSLQTITYNVTNVAQKYNKEMQRDITKSKLISIQSLGEDLSNLKSIYLDLNENDLQQQFDELSKTNMWLSLANYETSPIVQGNSYRNYFSEFKNILNIIWWRNLRLGNWKLFMNTLENYAAENSFQIYTGTSGVVNIPGKNTSDILKVKSPYTIRTVPGYIWTYLTSTDGRNKDFVIVAYNSPYSEWFDNKDVVFCPDVCSEIPWLKEIYPSFHYVTAGIMFCCSTDFIQQTNYLHSFPMDILAARSPAAKQTNVLEIDSVTEYIMETTTTLKPINDFDN